MAQKVSEIEVPELALGHCSVEEHCKALEQVRALPFWWYQGTSRILGNFSLPFQDKNGNWWYQVKVGLCWPADCFRPIDPDLARPPYSKSFLGYQHVVEDQGDANSHLVINAILDLKIYDADSINAKRRNAIRKGFRSCTLEVLTRPSDDALRGCLRAWNELSARTGWKHACDQKTFFESWRLLADCPGASIIAGRDNESGEIAGFVVTKIIGDTAYVDTIASCTDMLRTNVNDAVMYAFLINAAKLPQVTKAHYAIKSTVTKLEKFKAGLGFEPHPFPAVTRFRPGVEAMLKLCFPAKHRRMIGLFSD